MNSTLLALKLLLVYVVHNLVIMTAFGVLIRATMFMHDSSRGIVGETDQKICQYVEQGLFDLGAGLLSLVALCLAYLFLKDLVKILKDDPHPPTPKFFNFS